MFFMYAFKMLLEFQCRLSWSSDLIWSGKTRATNLDVLPWHLFLQMDLSSFFDMPQELLGGVLWCHCDETLLHHSHDQRRPAENTTSFLSSPLGKTQMASISPGTLTWGSPLCQHFENFVDWIQDQIMAFDQSWLGTLGVLVVLRQLSSFWNVPRCQVHGSWAWNALQIREWAFWI